MSCESAEEDPEIPLENISKSKKKKKNNNKFNPTLDEDDECLTPESDEMISGESVEEDLEDLKIPAAKSKQKKKKKNVNPTLEQEDECVKMPETSDNPEIIETAKPKSKSKKKKKNKELKITTEPVKILKEESSDEEDYDRSKKKKKKNASKYQSKIQEIKTTDSVDGSDYTCAVCSVTFSSKNKLFDHLKATKHAILVDRSVETNEENKSKKKGKRKWRSSSPLKPHI